MKLVTATCAALLVCAATTSTAQDVMSTPYEGSFEDATFAVENAIVNKGLVIDYVSHVGDMLNRTGSDVGSDKMLFEEAQIFVFCSAVVSRQVMEVDPMNIAYCPYGIFVADTGAGVTIGHTDYPEGAMKAVEDLLVDIVADAVAGF